MLVACFLPLSPLAQTAAHADRSVDAQASALAAQAQADWKRQAIDRDSLNRVTGDIASLRQDETSLREKGALTGAQTAELRHWLDRIGSELKAAEADNIGAM